MCREDLRIGRSKYSTARQESIAPGSDVTILQKAANRTHVLIKATGVGIRIAPKPFSSIGLGVHYTETSVPPIELDVEKHGDIVTQSWNGSGNGGTSLVLIIETFWEDDKK